MKIALYLFGNVIGMMLTLCGKQHAIVRLDLYKIAHFDAAISQFDKRFKAARQLRYKV